MADPRTPEQLGADIEAQRDELAHTVDQLTAKLDVRSRTRAKVADVKHRATNAEGGAPRPEVIAAAGSLLATVLVLVVWRLRRTP